MIGEVSTFWPGLIVLNFILGPSWVMKEKEIFFVFVLKNLEKTCPTDSECILGRRRCCPPFLPGEGAPVTERELA